MRVYGITIQPGKHASSRYRVVFNDEHCLIGNGQDNLNDLKDKWTELYGPVTSFLSLGGPYNSREAVEAMERVMGGKKVDRKQLASGERN